MTTLIQQRTGNDCVLAAIAMALGCERWEDAWTEDDLASVVASQGISDIGEWLERKGLKKREDFRHVYCHGDSLGVIKELLWARRALLSVHSLNNDGGSHMIYWDGERVWDPHEGHEGYIAFRHLSSAIITRAYIFKA